MAHANPYRISFPQIYKINTKINQDEVSFVLF